MSSVRLTYTCTGIIYIFPDIFQTDRDSFDLSPKLYDWGYDSKCAGAILFAVTDDAKLSLEYYPLFKVDHVARWAEHWEISEYEVREWLRAVGGGDV